MKVIVTAKDFEAKRLSKISKSIMKLIDPKLGIAHSEVLNRLAVSLGYVDLHDAQKTAEYFTDSSSFIPAFSVEAFVAPRVVEIKKQVFSEFKRLLLAENEFDSDFEVLPFKALEFFRGPKEPTEITEKFLADYEEPYFEALNFTSIEPFEYEQPASPTLRENAYYFLKSMDARLSGRLLRGSINELFEDKVVITYADGKEVTGQCFDVVFRSTHKSIIKGLLFWNKNRVIGHQEFVQISAHLLQKLKDRYGSLPVVNLFKALRNKDGFYRESGCIGYNCRWKTYRFSSNGMKFVFEICQIDDELVGADEISGSYWKCHAFDKGGSLLGYVSGGIYETTDPNLYPGWFPQDQNSSGSRESNLTSRISGTDLPGHVKQAPIIDKPFKFCQLATVSSWERSSIAESGTGLTVLKMALDFIVESFGACRFCIWLAPMQYVEWHPANDLKPLTASKKADLTRLKRYIKSFQQDVPLMIVKPRV